jgi:hypothetical protein
VLQRHKSLTVGVVEWLQADGLVSREVARDVLAWVVASPLYDAELKVFVGVPGVVASNDSGPLLVTFGDTRGH